ncbi:MAG: hypothetical protein ACK4HQ_00945 [Brevinematales bacterium]
MIIFSYGLELLAYIGMFLGAWDMNLLVGFRIFLALSYAVGFTVNASMAFYVLPPEKRTGSIAFLVFLVFFPIPFVREWDNIFCKFFRGDCFFLEEF